jgi:hypothetical protein
MDALQTALIKDDILKFLATKPNLFIDIDVIKKDLRLNSLSIVLLSAYIKEMTNDGVINSSFTYDGGSALILDMGHKLLNDGGYTTLAKELEEDRLIGRQKTKLEIQNLKLTKLLSIVAIILSIAALVVSILKK